MIKSFFLYSFGIVAYSCVLLLGYQCWSYPGQSNFVLLSHRHPWLFNMLYIRLACLPYRTSEWCQSATLKNKNQRIDEVTKQVCSVMSTEFVQISDIYLFEVCGRFCVATARPYMPRLTVLLVWSASSKPKTPVKC